MEEEMAMAQEQMQARREEQERKSNIGSVRYVFGHLCATRRHHSTWPSFSIVEIETFNLPTSLPIHIITPPSCTLSTTPLSLFMMSFSHLWSLQT